MQSSRSATTAALVPRAAQALGHAPDDVVTFGPFCLRPSERFIERSGDPVKLGGRALDILIALVDRAGEVVSQRELIDRVWPNVTVDDGNLRFHVSGLRKALGDGHADARHVINVAGRGYCFVGSVTRTPAGFSAPSATPPANAVRGLPTRLNRMVGRDAEVAAVAEQVQTQRFVTVLGPGGIGKTTVAVAVGRAVAPDELVTRLIADLAGRRTLLVMDSCDHVIETAAEWAEAIFAQAGGVSILATSREALRIEGEHVCRLAPLACAPLEGASSAAEVLAFPAAQLLADRIGMSCERFALLDSDAPIVARICAKLDGIALAIELAAGRVEAHGLDGVEALLDRRLNLLWQGRRTAPPRHQTLNATFDWSFDLLAEPERIVLQRLRVLTGSFTLEEAQIAARDMAADVDLIAEALASLVAKSLVMADTQCGRRCYRLLDTTRAYLHAKAASAAQAAKP
jgi:predicted ATPase